MSKEVEMDEKLQLEQILDKLRTALKKMQDDPRCSEDTEFENAVQKLHALVRGVSNKLNALETDYFKAQIANFQIVLDSVQLDADRLHDLVSGASKTIEVVGAIEQIVKVLHPLV
jgi:site-specific recombinase